MRKSFVRNHTRRLRGGKVTAVKQHSRGTPIRRGFNDFSEYKGEQKYKVVWFTGLEKRTKYFVNKDNAVRFAKSTKSKVKPI